MKREADESQILWDSTHWRIKHDVIQGSDYRNYPTDVFEVAWSLRCRAIATENV